MKRMIEIIILFSNIEIDRLIKLPKMWQKHLIKYAEHWIMAKPLRKNRKINPRVNQKLNSIKY